ncbi:hypothetical protein BDA96_10G179800 [Sorghum bicolor]|uniref:Uncharacterized protein n=1 Tax=Sorghum bicolor TaxID=4558 RepID=A0A921Q2E2_SORBI|nr:hypothetical protein BDA96_10G179800 [Sorghum bicolor]KAG0514310.1 hypothetical protein BDA96_10G179800 [Sorghum bicolor]
MGHTSKLDVFQQLTQNERRRALDACATHLRFPPHRAIPACVAPFLLPVEHRAFLPSDPIDWAWRIQPLDPSVECPAGGVLSPSGHLRRIQSIGHGGAPFPADLSVERQASLSSHQAPSHRCPLPFRSCGGTHHISGLARKGNRLEPWSCLRKGRSLQTAHGKGRWGLQLRGSLLGYKC